MDTSSAPEEVSAGPQSRRGRVSYDFSGQVVIVTGASGGIGGAVVDMFAAAGADLVLHGRNAEALDEAARRVRSAGRSAVIATGNIRDPETAEAIVESAHNRFGRIDILINNAGGNFAARLEDLSVNAWNATVASNLSGPFYVAKACLPSFCEQGYGTIVNIGSISANYAHPLRGAYAAAKSGLASLTRTMAWEWADLGVRVNCLEPGAVMSASSRFSSSETESVVARNIAMGRVGRPHDIAATCLFLCSDGAEYLTGETIAVAGGPLTSMPSDIDFIRPPV